MGFSDMAGVKTANLLAPPGNLPSSVGQFLLLQLEWILAPCPGFTAGGAAPADSGKRLIMKIMIFCIKLGIIYMNPQSKIKLLTDEEIMEKYDNGWIEMGAAQREIVRIKLAMEEYPIGTEEYGYLYVAQQALHYALDPTPCAQCEHPIITALRYGKYKKRLNQQSCPPHKNEDSQDC